MSSTSSSKPPASASITIRLTVLYLVSTLVILVCTNGFLLLTLVDDLEFEDNDFLSERISSLRSIIARHPDTAAALKDHVMVDHTSQHTRYLVRVLDAEGRTILETPGMADIPSALFPAAVISGQPLGRGAKYQSGASHYLLNAAWAEGLGNRHFRLVQVALDVSDEIALMEKYRLKMGIALLTSLCLAGGLGIIIARKGLQPLQEMTTTVALITATDLHQRVRSGTWPKELDHLTVALDSMLGRLEDSFARLADFSSNLAHELRTPINNLRGEAEVALSRARSADEYRRVIESSIEEYERLSRMVSDILFLARPEQGIIPHAIDARAEIEILTEYYQSLAEEQQISITIQGNGTAICDPRLFQRAVGNLISNALHYTPNGGQITIVLSPLPDGSLTIAIQDTGIGIPPDECPRVFERFYRSAAARQRYNQGSGLGLAIVRSIMELHGGSVTLTSKPGHGSTVTLRFPQC